jgi:hypothetical protein
MNIPESSRAEQYYFHQSENKKLSEKYSRIVRYPIKVYWSNFNKNWIIYDGKTGKKMIEFATGKPITEREICKHLSLRNRKLARETVKENKNKVYYAKQKVRQEIIDRSKEMAKDYVEYSLGPALGISSTKKSFLIEKK